MPLAADRRGARSPRHRRDAERIRRAGAAACGGRAAAMAVALAQIEAAFGKAATINAYKIGVERWMRLGPGHAAVRAHFRARAAMLSGRSLDSAIVVVERWWRDERTAFALASALGCAIRLPIEVLCELRLILRLMRWKRMQAEFESALAVLCNAPIATSAE